MTIPRSDREFDVVLYGASGFTGKQAAKYYAENVPRSQVNWALGGRSRDKLELVRRGLGAGFEDLPLVVADSGDVDALRAMAANTRVVQTTVGPYAQYGEGLVRACVETGTDYVDITGETPWVRHLIDTYHARAERKGVRIVNFCGVDSIPSDLPTFLMAQEVKARGETLGAVQGLFGLRGAGLNGGTLASLINLAESGQLDQASRPFLLNPGEEQVRNQPEDQKSLRWDPEFWTWTAPFMMAPVNTRVVRRSEALYRHSGKPYGSDFSYQEAMWLDEIVPATGLMVSGLSLAMEELVKLPAVTGLLRRFGPKPGEGPSEEVMEKSSLSVWFYGRTNTGRKVKARFACAGDPGNRVTVRLLSESALTLIHARDRLPEAFPGGVLTPATGLGMPLIERLRAAEVRLDFIPGDD